MSVDSPLVGVQLHRNTPDPNDDPFTAFYMILREASQALSFDSFDTFLTTILENCELRKELKGEHLYDRLAEIASLFVACHGAMIQAGFAESTAVLSNSHPGLRAPDSYLDFKPVRDQFSMSPLDLAQAERVYAPHKLDVGDLGKLAKALFQVPGEVPGAPGQGNGHDHGNGHGHKGNGKGQGNGPTTAAGHGGGNGGTTTTTSTSTAVATVPLEEPVAQALTLIQQLVANKPGEPILDDEALKRGDIAGFLRSRLTTPPLMELIWSYWQEEGMLVQGINAITLRFQNRRYPGGANLDRCRISSLRPLTSIIWRYLQLEPERLSLARRAYEYDHQYGLRLRGSAVPNMATADSRTRFIEAFHRVLQEACRFYRTSMDTTMHADAFPLLNCLRELHLCLAEGNDNQYGDLPTTARAEMLLQQWLIARPEIGEFLGGRPGVPYPEPWMGNLDTLRTMMGWNDASIRHYHDLANYGEILLLSVRLPNWSVINDSAVAANWLTAMRPYVQGYVHSYRAVTGVDMGVFDNPIVMGQQWTIQPSELIDRRRAAMQQPRIQ